MELGLNLPVVNPAVGPIDLLRLTRRAEDLGYAEVYLGEHVVLFDEQADAYLGTQGKPVPFPPTTALPDPLVTLAFLAAGTERIRLATGVIVLPQRNPVYTAKHIATVDWLSNGRLDVGIGIGWSELEFRVTSTPWERRGARCDAYVDVMRALWREGPSAYDGDLYDLQSCYQYPKPVQYGGPPLWFGGTSDAALRRIAGRGHGWYVFDTRPDELGRRIELLASFLEQAGRQGDEVKIVHGAVRFVPKTCDDVDAYAAVGVHQIVVSLTEADPAAMDRQLEQYAERILG